METINDWKINEEIRDKELRMIDEAGEQMGVLPLDQAMQISIERDLDLVLISPGAKPPVAKLMDYGKYRFETIKKEKDARKKQKVIKIKEVRLSPVIDIHDMNVRAKNAIKFLSEGDKVKASIRFKGRQMSYSDKGRDVMNTFFKMVEGFANMEKNPVMEGRNMYMIMTPKPQDKKATKSEEQTEADKTGTENKPVEIRKKEPVRAAAKKAAEKTEATPKAVPEKAAEKTEATPKAAPEKATEKTEATPKETALAATKEPEKTQDQE